MSASLVGSEMCIRDRRARTCYHTSSPPFGGLDGGNIANGVDRKAHPSTCLLYTSDAADDM
eukprot:1070839-Alexandrium_andersonii.AAC.1